MKPAVLSTDADMDFEKKGRNFRWYIFAFLRPPVHPTVACSLIRHRAEYGSVAAI
jgi:hypothetical protein